MQHIITAQYKKYWRVRICGIMSLSDSNQRNSKLWNSNPKYRMQYNTHHAKSNPGALYTQQCPQPQNCHHQQMEGTSPDAKLWVKLCVWVCLTERVWNRNNVICSSLWYVLCFIIHDSMGSVHLCYSDTWCGGEVCNVR